MSKFKNRLAKRVMAMILSGAMIMSNMTAFASEAPVDTGGGYINEVKSVDRQEDADIETAEKEDAVDNKTTNVSSKEETTSKDEDNVSSDKKDDNGNAEDTAKENVAADKADGDDEADAVEDDKASEMKSSLSAEVEEDESEEIDTETVKKEEDVKADTLREMESGQTYSFSADDLTEGNITENPLLGDGYFALQCSDATKVEATSAKTFRRFNAATNQIAGVAITNRIYLGGEGTTSGQSIKFITKESVDVIVYWVSNGADAQMTILNDDGETVAKTFKAAANDGILVSRMTLGKAGTYYLEGNSYIYKVEVMPASNSTLETDWDFTNNTKFPATTAADDKNITSIESRTAEEFHGLYIDTTGGGKWKKNSGMVQVNTGTIIYIPLEKRSKVTINFDSGVYTVDGVASTGNPNTFTCVGEGGYATVKVTTGSTKFYSIKVEPIETIKVEGDITLSPTKTDPYEIIFTEKTQKDDAPKSVIKGKVENNHYTVDLYKGLTYIVSFSDKSYNVTKNGEITIAQNESADKTWDVEAEAMSLTDVTGSIKFLDENGQEISIPDDLKLKFTSKGEGIPHIPDVTIDKTAKTYSVSLENDSTYTVTAEAANVEDYTYVPKELKADSPDTTITFTEKPRHAINVTVNSFDDRMDVSNSEITFTNVNEEGYQYSFTGIENVTLRDGTYSVSMDVKYPYKLDTSKNLVVSGAAKNYTLNFEERMAWDFTEGDPMLKLASALQNKPEEEFHGLLIDTSKKTLIGSFKDALGNSTTTFETNGKFDVQTSGRVQVNSSTEIKIPVSGKGTVKIVNQETSDTNHYTIDGVKATTEPQTWSYNKPAASYGENGEYIPGGYITLQAIKTKISNNATASDSIYLQKIIVEREKEIVILPGSRKIDVWDMGGVEEKNTRIYNNNITIAGWESYDGLTENATFSTTSTTFGDLTITHESNDRIYSASTKKTPGSVPGYGNFAYADGYTANGCYYANGTGGDNRRHITVKNVLPGDRIDAYVGLGSGTAITYYFEYMGSPGTQKDEQSIGATNKKLSFVAKYAGEYKIWADASGGKPVVNRIKRVPSVNVSGTITSGPLTSLDGVTVKFINETTKEETTATLDGTSFSASLAAGYSYNASLSGAVGYGFTNESKKVTLSDEDALTGKSDITLVIEEKETIIYAGTIKGFEEGYDTFKLNIIMKTAPDVPNDDVELTINKDALTFEATLESNVEYTITLEGANDYELKGDTTVKLQQANTTAQIEVSLKSRSTATGKFIGLDKKEITDLTVEKLVFKNVDDNYTYDADIVNNGYSVRLRDGAYIAEATVTGYSTSTHVVVNGADVSKDLLFVAPEPTSALDRVPDLYVGYPDKQNNYDTVNAAVKAAARMNPSSEAERITIHIAPGTYTEQLLITVPYITFKNDEPSKEVKLTWYYGIGYKYYSVKDGYYDEASAFDKYEKAEVKDWGTTVRLNAPGFRAENIIFENSFNQRIVEAELEDGVESAGSKPERKVGVDVESKPYKERACVMYINTGGDRAEFYRCKFISNQDTLGSGKAGTHSYFKECLLEGTTDYICGGGDCVFDECELRWAGQSDSAEGGYITAPSGTNNKGYLFWNCTITAHPDRKVSAGYLGRPWGADAKAIFVNTKLGRADLVQAVGWTEMGSNLSTVQNAGGFKEYNTTFNGTPVDTSKRLARTVVNENPVSDMKVYFGSWTPFYYVDAPVSKETRNEVPKGTTIELTCATNGATMYYTIDGSDPTAQSNVYSEPILLNEEKTVTIKAIAIKGALKSGIATFTYTVLDADKFAQEPTADPDSGEVEQGTKIYLNCATQGVTIYYTTDESDPTVADSTRKIYDPDAGIEITEAVTIKATAQKGDTYSGVATFVYTVKEDSGDNDTGIDPPTIEEKDLVVKLKGYDKYENGVYYYTYTGSAITPAIAVYYNGTLLAPTVDYTVKYTNNVNAAESDIGKKAPAVTVTGKGNFGKAKTVNFTISQKNLADTDIVGRTILVLDGSKAKTSDLTLYYGGIKLAYNKNFVIDTDDAATPDLSTNTTWSDKAYKIAVKAKENGNFSGSTKIDVIAVDKDTQRKNALVVKPKDNSKLKLKYNGAANTPATGDLGITVKNPPEGLILEEGKDYVISYPKDTTNVGTKKFTVKGISAKCIGTVTKSYSIIPNPEGTGLTVSLNLGNDNSKAFNGTSVTLNSSELVVKYNTTTLKEGTDYKVAYGNNKKISDRKSATYKITFLGNYKGVKKVETGSMTGEFTITAAALNKNTATVVIPDKVVKENSREGVYTSVPYVTLNNGVLLKKSDYTVSYLVNDQVMDKNNKAGIGSTVTVKITGKGNYAEETNEALALTETYKVITGTDLSKAKVEFYDNSNVKNKLSYTGNSIVPSKVVINSKEYTLCEDENNTGVYRYKDTDGKKFDITYANNIYKGKATAVITPGEGNNDYVGGKTATFNIVVRTFGQ